ncbi:hypothetical protein [Sphingomonas xinjiangensis]|uniref:Uncharacterized protein n=1 Tax=Sphingomonas xinjiangensis TaxID=643568 RepID=A0A840Y9U2_9SPHN|nr:hypothetical protein [Sphingomonas xinjiangensis]MBB5709614.1 hypothetical protein [Sphingomonas xinjiangensis]
MDEIEANLTLPKGALRLERYARYYTEESGRVHGAYTIEVETERGADFGCDTIQVDDTLKAVPCPAIADLRPGHRRWVQFRDYPAVAAEECLAVQIMYNPLARSFEHVECATPNY